jgi:ElaB/YqjD/DUF883 family membrane-anchored ribosome-binding protein
MDISAENNDLNSTVNRQGNGSRQEGGGGTDDAQDKFKALFSDVDDLISRVGSVDSADLRKIQAKLRVSLVAAKSALGDSATHLGRQARRVVDGTGDMVRASPWQAVGIASVLGLAVGILISRRR